MPRRKATSPHNVPKKNVKSSNTKNKLNKSKEWTLPKNFQISHINPLFRHRLQSRFRELLENENYRIEHFPEEHSIGQEKTYAVKLEMMLAIKCNFDAVLYEDRASLLLYTLEQNKDLPSQYDSSTLVSLDEYTLFPKYSERIEEFQREREMKRVSFETLLQKLTSEVEADGYPSLQCRKCGGQADFNPVQTRSADEPMTIFCTCLNLECKYQWKM